MMYFSASLPKSFTISLGSISVEIGVPLENKDVVVIDDDVGILPMVVKVNAFPSAKKGTIHKQLFMIDVLYSVFSIFRQTNELYKNNVFDGVGDRV